MLHCVSKFSAGIIKESGKKGIKTKKVGCLKLVSVRVKQNRMQREPENRQS